ncbi:RidA family protein [Fangia hongkongensis]|uniref:RidA family protein n=1 Tax=Fangia hongkongensis TaxID=270495 RepID=UPI00036C911D|nr:RidA family protein [Fangia hongkongensis]MBK2124600.1 RidA family protein [Fangia hongkongensis]
MEKEIVTTNAAPAAIGPYVQAVKFNNLLYTSGQISLTPEGELISGSIEEQTHRVMQNLKALLHDSNSSLSQVLKTTCFLANMDDFARFNSVYESYFEGVFPARSCVEVSRLPKDVLIEVEAVAFFQN